MLSQKQRTWIFITLMFSGFLVAMTITVTNIQLSAVMEEYAIPSTTAQWLSSGATLLSGIMIPLAAFLMKRLPSKRYHIISMVIYTVGSLVAFMARGFPLLLFGRLIQAAACGMMMSFSQIVLMAIYPKEKYGSILSASSMASLLAPVLTPTLCGMMIDSLGWQSIFGLLSAAGLLALLMGAVCMRNVTEQFTIKLPISQIILCASGLGGIIIGIGNLSSKGLLDFASGGFLLLGIFAFIFFTKIQASSSNALLDMKVFRERRFIVAVLISTLVYLIGMGSGTLLPIYVQTQLGFSASSYALATLPGAVLMMCITLIAGRMYDQFGPKPIVLIGSFLLLLGSVLGVFFSEATLLHIGAVSGLLATGMGFLNSPISTMALSSLYGRKRVDGSAILNTLRQISGALAAVASITIYSFISSLSSNNSHGVQGTYLVFFVCSVLLLAISWWFAKSEVKVK